MESLINSYEIIAHNGVNTHQIIVSGETSVSITVPNACKGSISLEVKGSGTLKLHLEVQAHADFKYLWLNQSDESLEIEETLYLQEGAQLIASYGELSLGNHSKTTTIACKGINSNVEFKSAIMAFGKLVWKITALHQARRSKVNVNCNAIVLDNANLHLEIAGKIEKGNSGSETHQMTRIMNLGANAKGIVYPMLLIDENDVAASHAASVGQANEDHIYYLQSRGLTRLESLKLITTGYLMPIVEGIDNEVIKEQLKEEILKKVNNQWQ